MEIDSILKLINSVNVGDHYIGVKFLDSLPKKEFWDLVETVFEKSKDEYTDYLVGNFDDYIRELADLRNHYIKGKNAYYYYNGFRFVLDKEKTALKYMMDNPIVEIKEDWNKI